MKWEHDSDTEDTTMAAPTADLEVGEQAATLKESLLVRGHDEFLVDRNQDPFADHIEEIQDEVSHMVVETNIDGAQSTMATATSQEDTPACSTSTSMASLASAPSPASMTSSPKEPASPNKSKAPSSLSSTPNEPIDSRPSVDRTQTSGNTYNRSGHWSFSTSSAYSYSAPTLSMSSLIHSKESVYAAVPVSSELYIIPKSSRGFHWNGDLFLKPHQRRSLGVDHMFSSPSANTINSNNYNSSGSGGESPLSGQHPNQHLHNQDSSMMVHEIRLDEHEIDGILPSWP
ncbi:hypothetical protein BGZ96_012717 [Linnemannia gamsii]|uniref:Uncharacterized protein n=1 Tax=Linnemannia gamsii TaxID=64522 RepID=A0ABQ7JPV4_9FUNG|nr:hypothetical protein BGZ96_012717 [Linnemannia gamsii]